MLMANKDHQKKPIYTWLRNTIKRVNILEAVVRSLLAINIFSNKKKSQKI